MAVDEQEQSPFTKPGFIAASLVVAVIVVLGVFLGIRSATGDDESTAPPASPSASASSSSGSEAPTAEPSAAADGASVCGLAGNVPSGRIAAAPEAVWEYQDITAYPTSKNHGPAKTNAEGVRYCFQHSPEGALFAAANATVQSTGTTAPEWIEYFLSVDSPDRAMLLQDTGSGASSDFRTSIEGFKLLSYDEDTARVDIAVSGSGSGNTAYASLVFDLVWEDGDWKLLPQNAEDPFRMAQIPNTAGYISWKG